MGVPCFRLWRYLLKFHKKEKKWRFLLLAVLVKIFILVGLALFLGAAYFGVNTGMDGFSGDGYKKFNLPFVLVPGRLRPGRGYLTPFVGVRSKM